MIVVLWASHLLPLSTLPLNSYPRACQEYWDVCGSKFSEKTIKPHPDIVSADGASMCTNATKTRQPKTSWCEEHPQSEAYLRICSLRHWRHERELLPEKSGKTRSGTPFTLVPESRSREKTKSHSEARMPSPACYLIPHVCLRGARINLTSRCFLKTCRERVKEVPWAKRGHAGSEEHPRTRNEWGNAGERRTFIPTKTIPPLLTLPG